MPRPTEANKTLFSEALKEACFLLSFQLSVDFMGGKGATRAASLDLASNNDVVEKVVEFSFEQQWFDLLTKAVIKDNNEFS